MTDSIQRHHVLILPLKGSTEIIRLDNAAASLMKIITVIVIITITRGNTN